MKQFSDMKIRHTLRCNIFNFTVGMGISMLVGFMIGLAIFTMWVKVQPVL